MPHDALEARAFESRARGLKVMRRHLGVGDEEGIRLREPSITQDASQGIEHGVSNQDGVAARTEIDRAARVDVDVDPVSFM